MTSSFSSDINLQTNTDCYIEIGHSHHICQDYAFTNGWYTIVSDGCSSAPDTDIGARILVLSAKNYLNSVISKCLSYNIPDYTQFGNAVIKNAVEYCTNLKLPLETLDATLIVTFCIHDQVINYTYGDGYVIIILNNGKTIYKKYEFAENAPYYLVYQTDDKWIQSYKKTFGGKRTTHIYNEDLNNEDSNINWTSYDGNYNDHQIYNTQIKNIKQIITATDGLGSFTSTKGFSRISMDDIEICKKIHQFKNTNGAFVTRRINRLLSDLKRTDSNITHYDDIAIAVLNIETIDN